MYMHQNEFKQLAICILEKYINDSDYLCAVNEYLEHELDINTYSPELKKEYEANPKIFKYTLASECADILSTKFYEEEPLVVDLKGMLSAISLAWDIAEEDSPDFDVRNLIITLQRKAFEDGLYSETFFFRALMKKCNEFLNQGKTKKQAWQLLCTVYKAKNILNEKEEQNTDAVVSNEEKSQDT